MDKKTNVKRKEVDEFLTLFHKFQAQGELMCKERQRRSIEDSEYNMMLWRFIKTIINPMEEAWKKLIKKEKEELFSLIFKDKLKEWDITKDVENVNRR